MIAVGLEKALTKLMGIKRETGMDIEVEEVSSEPGMVYLKWDDDLVI